MNDNQARDIYGDLTEGFDALEGQRKGHLKLRTMRGPNRSARPLPPPVRKREATPGRAPAR